MNEILEKTRQICREYNIKPARSRGQSFLICDDIYNSIVENAQIREKKILEVGPGLGFLTEKLVKEANKVVSIELDHEIVTFLKQKIRKEKINNLELIEGNALDFRPDDFGEYNIVANLPYTITSVFLKKFLTAQNKPNQIVLMLQKEVVDRIVAGPGKMSILAISVQFYADVEVVKYVKSRCFFPEPKVDSAIIKIDIHRKNKKIDEKNFFRLVKIGFSSKRKKLKNNLSAGYQIPKKEIEKILEKARFDINIRAQDLAISDWIELLKFF